MTKAVIKKTFLLLIGVGIVGLFMTFDLQRYLTLEYLQSSQESFRQLYAESPAQIIALFSTIYFIVAAFALPGAAIMTLASGALFGLVTGTLIASFASTAGATVACLVSRYVLRDWVQKRFAEKLVPINKGVEREGGFYLFTMRLIPVFPFFLINLVMGLTRIKMTTFSWVSQLGMLPATIVFVNAGKELGKIESLSDILSPGLLFSFVLLGLFPITVKKLMGLIKK